MQERSVRKSAPFSVIGTFHQQACRCKCPPVLSLMAAPCSWAALSQPESRRTRQPAGAELACCRSRPAHSGSHAELQRALDATCLHGHTLTFGHPCLMRRLLACSHPVICSFPRLAQLLQRAPLAAARPDLQPAWQRLLSAAAAGTCVRQLRQGQDTQPWLF